MSIRAVARRLTALHAALVMLLLAACSPQPDGTLTSDAAPPNLFPGKVVTESGRLAADLYLPVFVIAVGIFVLVEGLLLYMAWRFRRRPSDPTLPTQVHGHDRLEIVWTAIPALIVAGLFIASMNVLTSVQARSDPPAVTVDVMSFQWQWTFEYPEYGLSYTGVGKVGPEMVLPVGEPVRIRLGSVDVIHSFYVPQFFTKLDAIPGRTNELDVTILEPGAYGGQCAEFCGLGHADMFFTVRAVPRAEYDAWVQAEMEAAAASPGPEAPTSPAPGSPAPGSPSPATQAPEGILLEIASLPDDPIAFTKDVLEAQAGAAITVAYLNDTSVPHNIAFFEGPDASAPRIAATEIVTGPGALRSVSFTAPESPGSYYFHCDVHPVQMTGTFIVTG